MLRKLVKVPSDWLGEPPKVCRRNVLADYLMENENGGRIDVTAGIESRLRRGRRTGGTAVMRGWSSRKIRE